MWASKAVLTLIRVVFTASLPGILTSAAFPQAIVSLAPRKGEIRLYGTVTAISREKGRCTLLVTRVLVPDGAENGLRIPKPKTVAFDAATTYAIPSATGNDTLPVIGGAAELRPGTPVMVIGRDTPGSVVAARLICLLNARPAAAMEEETREPSEPPGKNLLLPTDAEESWTWTVMEPAKATLDREEGMLKITVADTGKEDWRIQVAQTAVFPEPGVSYTLAFRARAVPPRLMRLAGQVLGSDFHDIGLNRYAMIWSEWHQYEYTFVAHNLGAKGHLLPVFFFGTDKGTTCLADVRLAVSEPEQRGNLLEAIGNPGAWKLLPLTKEGSAALRITGDRMEISTSAVSKTPRDIAYHLRLATAPSLVPGRTYALSFRGSSGVERTLRIRGIAEPVKLGPDEQSFEFRFTVRRMADFGACPTFLIGEQLGTFTLSNLVLREERPTEH